jgi:uncharacterized protein (TIGR02996 family)
MSDRAALLAAVKAFPENDAPRLIFADWLDENGDERDRDWAALIRWGCKPENRAMAFDVEREHVTAFGWRLPARVADGVHTLRRGFYEAFTGTAAAWLEHADALLAEHPVRRTTLTTFPRDEHGKFISLESLAIPGIAFSTWQQAQALNSATQDAFEQAAPLPPDDED